MANKHPSSAIIVPHFQQDAVPGPESTTRRRRRQRSQKDSLLWPIVFILGMVALGIYMVVSTTV